jgi:serine/threonine protein kinase
MAPEVMCRQNHGVAVDYFAMGVIAYECMFGKRPYHGKDRKEIRDHILSKQVKIRENEIPRNWSLEAADFINRLIQRKPGNRLGKEGPQVLKDHDWFRGFNWDALYNKQIPAPFVPPRAEDNFDAKYTNSEWKDANSEAMQQHQAKLKRPSIQKLFDGYYHDENVHQTQKREGPTSLVNP